jgi:hypothetical protein
MIYLTRKDNSMRAIFALIFALREKIERLELLRELVSDVSLRTGSAFPCASFSLSSLDSWAFFRKSTASKLSPNGSSTENRMLSIPNSAIAQVRAA